MSQKSTPLMTEPPGCLDNSFGPFAGYQCRGGFDFTLLFEEAIFTIPLQCLLLIALPVRISKLLKAGSKVRSGFQRPAKAVATICLLGLNAALLALWMTAPITKTATTIPTASLVLIASLGLCLLSWLEHDRSIRPSFVAFTYLFFSVLLDLPRIRTLWLLKSNNIIPIVMACSLALRAIMVVLESIEKRSILTKGVQYSFESTSSTFSRATFLWLNPLFKLGYKKILTPDDLYPLDERLQVDALHQKLSAAWEKVPNKDVPGVLFSTWLAAFRESLMAPIIPRLCVMGFTYSQPFVIKQAIILGQLPKTEFFDNYGYGLIGAFALVYTGLSVAAGQYMWRVRRTSVKIRGSLFALIYQKSLRLDITSPSVSPMAGITLIGTDTETIIGGMNMFHELWANLVEIAIATWLIYRELGPACAMPIALAVATLFATGFISMPIGAAQAKWIQASQERVTATSKTLGSIKRLRISGLNDLAFKIIKDLRAKEMIASKKFRLLLGASLVLLVLLPLWSPILTFATWAGVAKNSSDDSLSLGKVFASYLFILLLATPLTQLLIALPAMIGAMACFQRIQNHLNGQERQDVRQMIEDEDRVAVMSLDQEKAPKAFDSSGSNDNIGSELTPKQSNGNPAASMEDNIIATVKGTFSWSKDSDPVITIPNWNIERGTFTFVVGPVGCGKSTLLKTLLGELSSFDGTICTRYSGLAYCDQSPWLPNETVRNIITGHAQFDDAWYQTVIGACALTPDFANWSEGDETVAGSQGISFSGGQKQRLAIARAVYSRRKFLVFDDALSGLDAATENKLFTKVFGLEGLLRRANMTVVFATSSTTRLRHADRIILLNEKGHFDTEGSPEELMDLLKLSEVDLGWEAHIDTEKDVEKACISTAVQAATAVVEAEIDQTRRLGDNKTYMFYARAAGRHMIVTMAICMAIYAFCVSFPTLWIGWWGGADDPLDNLGKWLGVYVALGVGAVISIGTGLWNLLILIINRAGIRFHDDLADIVSSAPMSFHSTVDSGVTVNRFSQDLRLIDMELPQSLFSVSTTTASLLAQFILVCVVAKYMTAFLPVLGIIIYLIQFVYLRTSRQLRLLDIEQTAPLYTQLIETLTGLSTIRAFQWEDQFEQKNMGHIDNSQKPYYLLASVQSWLTYVTDIFVAIIALAFIVIATTLRDRIGAGLIGTGLSNILGFSNSMKAFVTHWVMLETALGAVSRVRSFIAATPSECDEEERLKEPTKHTLWPTDGGIEIRNITASYTTSGPVLRNISLSIRPGERVGICGRTGSGKSSLALCFLRMLNLDGGSISIDGVDLRKLPHEYVRSRLVALPQDSYIFDGTVRLNVDPTKTASDEQILDVLKKVHLWSKVEARGGLEHIIHDDFFSPGESQLLVFARAMLRTSKILILDEFTSSLDSESSAIVDELLATSFQDWTIVAIAHKLDSIIGFDKIAVLDAGSLIEYDSPGELLATNSVFKDMYLSVSQKKDGTDQK